MTAVNLYRQIISHPDYFYCEDTNSFNSKEYQSKAGNNYHFELRLIEGIIIKAEIGIGHKFTFLNKLQIFEIKTKKLLDTSEFHNHKYNQDTLIDQAVHMLSRVFIANQSDDNNIYLAKDAVPQIFQKVNSAFKTDQRAIAQKTCLNQLVA